MKIYIDDVREFPKSGFSCFRNLQDCMDLIEIVGKVEFLDIDYDLGNGETTLSLLEFIKDKGIKVDRINIHSDHEEGIRILRRYCEEYFPDIVLSCYKQR